MALPRPKGKRGGVHESSVPWTPDEMDVLLWLRPLDTDRTPSWPMIARDLEQTTGRPRSAASVRLRWLRMRNGRARAQLPKGDATRAKNICGRCGVLRLGHVCAAARDESGGEESVDAMTEQVRRAIEEGALESDEEL